MIMKYIYSFLTMFLCAISFVSCGEDDFLEIESLNANGDEFYCNQKVKVWMCVHSSDLWQTTYRWSCDRGTLTQPQGLNEMTWKAPSTPGTYTITCEATVGGVTKVRSHKMYVSRYYFETFENTSHSLSLQSSSSGSLKKNGDNQFLQVTVSSSAEVNRYIRRSFDDGNLFTPFSTLMELGFNKNIPTKQMLTVGKKTGQATWEYRWNLRADASNKGSYLNQIRLVWFPAVPKDGYPSVPDGNVTVEGSTDYNVLVSVQHTGSDGKKATYNEYHKLNTLNVFTKTKVYKKVSMAVDENKRLLVYVDANEVLSSNLVNQAYTEKACEGDIAINNWEFYFMNGDGGKSIPEIYIDNAEASNIEILK